MFELFIIISGVISRLLPHAPNFTPIAAIALFGGVYLKKRYAIILPLFVMLISDFFLGFHDTMLYVYGAFFLTGLLGVWLRKHKKIGYVIGSSVLSSLLFFLITNFGVWAQGWYGHSLTGLWQSYIMGIPFFKNTLMGDLLYTGIFFGSYESVKAIVSGKLLVLRKAETQK
jgi:hypothetical protein